MDLTGEYRIPATREKVWAALNDDEGLKQCIDGCEELKKESDTEFSARVTAKVGPVKAKFSGKVTLSELDPPNGYTISGEGQGGVAGFAKGGATVKLTEDGADTILNYAAKAEVGGKLASVGSRLIEGVAKKTADDFFGKFSGIVGGDAAETGAAETDPMADQSANEAAVAPKASEGSGIPAIWWGVGIVIVGAILLFAASG